MRVHCLIFEEFSDWEIAFILPELRKNSVEVTTVGFSKDEVTSMGGLKVRPDTDLYSLDLADIETFIIPGGTFWEKNVPDEFIAFTQKLHSQNALIAAICGATIALGQSGLLDSRKHTSNDANYLKQLAPSYKGETHYSTDFAVYDQNIISASGIGAIEFAKIILTTLNIYDDERASNWFNLFKHGKWTGPI